MGRGRSLTLSRQSHSSEVGCVRVCSRLIFIAVCLVRRCWHDVTGLVEFPVSDGFRIAVLCKWRVRFDCVNLIMKDSYALCSISADGRHPRLK